MDNSRDPREIEASISRAEAFIEELRHEVFEVDERTEEIRRHPESSKNPEAEFLLLCKVACRCNEQIEKNQQYVKELRFLAKVRSKFRNDQETLSEVVRRDFPELMPPPE